MTELNIKNRQLPAAMQALTQLAQEKKIPAKLRWQAVRLKGALQPLLEDLSKAENELVREYARLGEDGELLPGLDKAGKVLPGTWSFQDLTPAFEPTERTEMEPPEALAARHEAIKARVLEFRTRHDELMVVNNIVIGTQFPIDDFELSELTGEQLQALEFLLVVTDA